LEPFAGEDVLDAGGTVDFLPLALAMASGIGLRFGYLTYNMKRTLADNAADDGINKPHDRPQPNRAAHCIVNRDGAIAIVRQLSPAIRIFWRIA
jgi:hypothetical protein